MDQLIVEARIQHPEGFGASEIFVRYEGQNEWIRTIQFYNDEISFTAGEVVGLTRCGLWDLRHKKDVAYLRS